jgi:hypothetical protein
MAFAGELAKASTYRARVTAIPAQRPALVLAKTG